MLVLVFYLCPSSVRVVATFSGTVLFPLLCSVLPFFFQINWLKVKVKQSHYRRVQAQGFQEADVPRFQDSRHMKVVKLSALRTGRLYPQKIFLVFISVRGWVNPKAIVRPEVLCQWKIPMTSSEIEPATFRLVAQYLNQLRHSVPQYIDVFLLI